MTTHIDDCMALDAAGRTMLLADARGTPTIWDIETGQVLGELPKQDHLIDRVVFSPDGQHLVMVVHAREKSILLWDAH